MKYGYSSFDGKIICGPMARGNTIWDETGSHMIGRSDCGVHNTPQAAKHQARNYLRALIVNEEERINRNIERIHKMEAATEAWTDEWDAAREIWVHRKVPLEDEQKFVHS